MTIDLLEATLTRVVPFSKKEWAAVRSAFRPRTLIADETLLQEGAVCDELAFVAKGLLVTRSSASARETSCDLFAEGDFATDYVSFLTRAPATVSVVTLEPCEVFTLSQAALNRLYEEWPVVERLGRKIAEQRFIASVQRAGSLLSESPGARYRALGARRPDLLQRVPQYVLARWLGVTPESLSRIRRRLSKSPPAAT